MCPNCGTTINLENRKEVDFNLIRNATGKHPRTFTDLLHITKLSRKTLSLRLKGLCKDGVLIKEEGMYKLNGVTKSENNNRNFVKGFSSVLNDKRMRRGLLLIALCASFSFSGYALAMLLAVPQLEEIPHKPVILGNFTLALEVSNVNDLYAWQVSIDFNSTQLKALKVSPGDFFEVEFPCFVNASDVDDGVLLLGGTLKGDALGKDGSGTLATITFGYYVADYVSPTVDESFPRTFLLNSSGSIIEMDVSTRLMLSNLQNGN